MSCMRPCNLRPLDQNPSSTHYKKAEEREQLHQQPKLTVAEPLVPTTTSYSLKYCFYCRPGIPQPAMTSTIAVVTVLLCALVAVSAAAPEPQARTIKCPARGCVQISYTRTRLLRKTTYRSYICDGPAGACVLSFDPTCRGKPLLRQAAVSRLVNVRGKQYSFRYYNQLRGTCWRSPMPPCCTSVKGLPPLIMEEETHPCRCETFPTGERICDPVDCESAEGQQFNQQFLEDQQSDQQFLEDQQYDQQFSEDQQYDQQFNQQFQDILNWQS